jgi:hypothetical protein
MAAGFGARRYAYPLAVEILRSMHMAEVRRKIRWPTGKRKGKSRVWKTRWVIIQTREKKKA